MIEQHLDEPIVFTKMTNDTMDAESKSYWIEIKCRLPSYHWSDGCMQSGWLIPACKILRARENKKATRFYYYWQSDKSLWYWDYNEKDLEGLKPSIPPHHRDSQLHFYLPQRVWSSV